MAPKPEVQPEITPEETMAHIGDLLDGTTPAEEDVDPNLEANPPEDDGTPKEEPKPEGEGKPEGGEPKPEVTPEGDGKVITPVAKTYEYRGKQYTLDQMAELGILDDVIQTARQFPVIQSKYQQILERGVPQTADQTRQEAPRGPSAEQIVSAYAPVAEKLAIEGHIEKEAYEAFPRLVSGALFLRDLVFDLRQTVAIMVQREVERDGTSQKTTFLNMVDNTSDRIAAQGGHFELLKDPEVRKGFYGYLATLNIPANEVDEACIKRQWIAYNSEPILEAIHQTVNDRKVQSEKVKRNATGEGGGPRPTPPAKVQKTATVEHIDSLLEGSFPTGG